MKNLLIVLYALFTVQLFAQSSDFYEENGYAVMGYDVVAYFDQKAVKGDERKFSYNYQGTKFAFSSQQNLLKFKASPEKYLPQYGGHCAYAMATLGEKVSPNPEVFEIRDGKLFLFHREKGLKSWLKEDPSKLMIKADANWSKMLVVKL